MKKRSKEEIVRDIQHALKLIQAGRLPDSEKVLRRLLDDDPGQLHALQLLAMLAAKVGKLDMALDFTRRAVAAHPADVPSRSNLAKYLIDAGKFEEALASAQTGIALQPNFAEAHYNAGVALQTLGRADEAARAYQHALQLQPAHTQALANLANLHKDAGETREAIALLRQTLQHSPRLAPAWSNLLHTLHFSSESTAASLLAEHRAWRLTLPAVARATHINSREKDRRLRIGFLSSNFREGRVGRGVLAYLANRDRSKVEITCFANQSGTDDVTLKIIEEAEAWQPISHLTDDAAIALMRKGPIDILVDMSMHTSMNRTALLARKPAPVQVCYLAYDSTTGLEAIDYRLSDPFVDAPGEPDADRYAETTVRLTPSSFCYAPHPSMPAGLQGGAPPAEAAGHMTFGCLASLAKVSDEALAAWGKILAAVPGSVLLLQVPAGLEKQFRARAEKCGIPGERLRCQPYLPFAQYIKTYQRMDVAFDPFPFAGAVTTCDALYMGVPVVTLKGRTAVGRSGLSILSNLGLTEFVAESPEQYAQLAIALANDAARRSRLRAELRGRMEKSPLMDGPGFARSLEADFREMWIRWCEAAQDEAGMNIQLQFALTADDYCEFNSAFRKNRKSLIAPSQRGLRSPAMIVIVMGFAAWLACVLWANVFEKPAATAAPAAPVSATVALQDAIAGVLPYLVILCAFMFLVVLLMRSKYLYRRLATQVIRIGEPKTVEISEAGVTIREPGALMQMQWPYYMRFIESQSLFLLFTMPRLAHIVPKLAFASQAEMDAFRAFAQAHVGNQPIGFPVQPAALEPAIASVVSDSKEPNS